MYILEGERILSLRVSDGEHYLSFETPDGFINFEAEGDCCSESWFADITGVDALIGGTVTEVDDVYVGEVEDGRTRQEYDNIYGYKITTNKGRADIVFRNSSNGYYGGWLNNYSGPLPDNMKYITEDWSA